MGADGNLLKGEITEDPKAEERKVEELLCGFLKALVNEQLEGLKSSESSTS
ncbi:MAG: hypothetical protein HYX41_08150 [Bdellovibrio sp.]|nr:hypothetical protein [Bdellovibrio sp.]